MAFNVKDLFFFLVILFASTLDNSAILWILIAIAICIYMLRGCFDCAPTTSALMSTAGYLENIPDNMMPHTRIDIPIPLDYYTK